MKEIETAEFLTDTDFQMILLSLIENAGAKGIEKEELTTTVNKIVDSITAAMIQVALWELTKKGELSIVGIDKEGDIVYQTKTTN